MYNINEMKKQNSTSQKMFSSEELNELNHVKDYIDNLDDEIENSIESDFNRDSVKLNNVDINSEIDRNSWKYLND